MGFNLLIVQFFNLKFRSKRKDRVLGNHEIVTNLYIPRGTRLGHIILLGIGPSTFSSQSQDFYGGFRGDLSTGQ